MQVKKCRCSRRAGAEEAQRQKKSRGTRRAGAEEEYTGEKESRGRSRAGPPVDIDTVLFAPALQLGDVQRVRSCQGLSICQGKSLLN